MKPLLLGEAPSRFGDRYWMLPLSGRPSRVLCELAGIPPQAEGSTYGRWTWALREHFDCLNLIGRYADATPWNGSLATLNARDLGETFAGRLVVCLGRRTLTAVCNAFDLGKPLAFYERVEFAEYEHGVVSGFSLVSIPHPSGLNRLLNDPAERERAGEVLREALREVPV